ncbi:glycosyltransferase [candidate division WOR-3 bacterium]|nr:glycosyltransferase [candidate division WOR-3 bacterium]
MGSSRRPEVSVIVPAFNEADNIVPLLDELAAKLDSSYEVVVVDDGSTDQTYANAVQARGTRPSVRVVRHAANQGKTAAILTGLSAARGNIISVFDADMQFMPDDIVVQVQRLRDGADIVTGWKQGRYEKRFVSGVYNWLARVMFGLRVHDINALKTFRREVLEGMSLRRDWHRYIVPLAAARGFRVAEVPVTLRPRLHGVPKYSGKLRILIGLFDLVAVAFQVTFMRKPMLYFGFLGAGAFGCGLVVGIVAVVLRILGHGFRPMLYLVVLLVLAGIVLFAAGFLGESLAGMSDRLDRVERLLSAESPRDRSREEEPEVVD